MKVYFETSVDLDIAESIAVALRDLCFSTRSAVIDEMATAYCGDDGEPSLDDADYEQMVAQAQQNLDNAIALLGRIKAAKVGA